MFYSIVSLVCIILSIWMISILSIKSNENVVLQQENDTLNQIIITQHQLTPSIGKTSEFPQIKKIHKLNQSKKNLFFWFIGFYVICGLGFLCFRYCEIKRIRRLEKPKKE